MNSHSAPMVSRCICCEQTFDHALDVVREHGCRNVAELQEHMYISRKCGLCIPFVQRMIETGETMIPLMSVDETVRWSARSGLEDREPEA